MGVSSSLYASISGLSTMGNAMSVLGDNVSNVNTIAFKSSTATFQDVLSQSVATAAGSAQVGRGVTLTSIDGIFAQGSFESTSNPTDLAIGGQGFFMLRAPSSAAADMYTRAGQFGFDNTGNLTNPTGNFVQGWTIDPTSGEVQGSIGDINIGKSTPPVATTSVQVIANVDSRKVNETTEHRLFDAWNGTNPSLPVPTAPIDSSSYQYTTAIKAYDSVGASHDLTVYFDRTTQDNQWEFLVTCNPAEDKRVLTTGVDPATGLLNGSVDQAAIYTPDTTYNYVKDKGAGALLYGVVNFSTSGSISTMSAWNVPPDGVVDPALDTNRLVLTNTDKYYSFETNFTGAATNQKIALNLGASYSGQSTAVPAVLVSDGAAYSTAGTSTPITKETLWNTVHDSNGNLVDSATPAVVTFAGYNHSGAVVPNTTYTLVPGGKVQDLLDAMDAAFNCNCTIDSFGKIKMTDNTGGAGGLAVTRFAFSSGVNPFGGATTTVTVPGVISGDATHFFATDNAGTLGATSASLLNSLFDDAGPGTQIATNDTFQFSGTAANGTAIAAGPATTFTVGAGSTVQNLLDFLSGLYATGVAGPPANANVSATLGADGRIHIADNTGGGSLAVTIAATTGSGSLPLGTNGTVFGAVAATASVANSQINVTTAKREVISTARAVTTAGGPTPIIGNTPLTSVFDGGGTALTATDSLTFSGTRGDGTVVNATFTAGNAASGVGFGPPLTAPNNPPTMQDLLTWVEEEFHASASVDGAGRLVLTDWKANDVAGYQSQLAIASVTNPTLGHSNPFGAAAFTAIPADVATEDGSRAGGTESVNFNTEALSTTQYANSSTTIFQDQNGFAAGFLQSVSVDTTGVITGNYSNGQVLKKAQVALASFNNLEGLRKEGGNVFRQTTASGAPITGAPGTNGLGSISPNSLEQSNVDLGAEFVKLITTQRGFQANSKIITTTDEMLQTLIDIKR